MEVDKRKRRGLILHELFEAQEQAILAALCRYFRSQPKGNKKTIGEEDSLFRATLRYFGETR